MTGATAATEGSRYDAADIADLLGIHRPTDEQAAVIEAPLRPSVVIAGAGSGKTETMAARVVWLVANGLVAPDRILGLTFTRKAAAELQHRIRSRLRAFFRVVDPAGELAGDPTVLTYAAYAGRIVDEHAILLGREPGSRLLTEAARWQLADAAVRRYDGAFAVEPGVVSTVTDRTLDLAGQLADHLVAPEAVRHLSDRIAAQLDALPRSARSKGDYPAETAKFLQTLAKRTDLLPLIARFAEAKLERSAMDFADQMVLATRLADLPAVAQVERSRYDVVLLDEYQDTGHAQVAMLAGLFADGRPVTAVGDPLQSIYGWRGASAANITQFAERFRSTHGEPAERYGLMTSWRNDRTILAAANRVAEPIRVPGDAPLALRPGGLDGYVGVAYLPSVVDEANWIAARLRSEWDLREQADWTHGQRTLAVLVRKRSGIALIAQAVRDAGMPVEVVDLGGLLTLPEIADVRAVLQVLSDHNAGGSLGRLLTGARWRIGPADLVALHDRARVLSAMAMRLVNAASPAGASGGPGALASKSGGPGAAASKSGGPGANGDSADPDDDERIDPSLVEALDDLGDPHAYSAEGFRRLSDCAGLLRRLRRRLELPLPDLIAEVERALGLDVEIAARPEAVDAATADAGRANLDRFIDESARFINDRSGPGLSAFLAYLAAAESEEYGLKPAVVEVQAERVQILTVHGAKGLEWDVVVVAGLVEKGFPDQAKSHDWATAPALLPSDLRGDRDQLPALSFTGCADRSDAEQQLKAHRAALSARHLLEERRLAYVAFTRARKALFACGAAWGAGSTPRPPSAFLVELSALATDSTVHVEGWHELAAGELNPAEAADTSVAWPADPLRPERRVALESAAAAVRRAMAPAASFDAQAAEADAPSEHAAHWRQDVALLLAERAAAEAAVEVEVAVPDHLSVSDVVSLGEDPESLARRIRRPVPHRPAKQARRGTAFHRWLEQRWAGETLLDIDELPGAVDEVIDDRELERFKARFEASRWADQTPVAVEVPFEMSFGGRVIRGRMDAVFSHPGGRFTVVDWKTGRPPAAQDARAKAVQLALYRLAWAELCGIGADELDRVAAAFYYVGADVTVAPADLLSAEELRRLVNG